MVVHVMVDLETWGTAPGSDIRSIGACVFSPDTSLVHDGSPGTITPFYLACDNGRGYWGKGSASGRFFRTNKPNDRLKYNLRRDYRTIQWWNDQSEDAQAAFTDPVDLWDVLKRFTVWIDAICSPDSVPPSDGHTNLRLWSHGPAFDPVLLTAAYEAVDLPVPWHYRTLRDTRTLFDVCGITDHSAWMEQHPGPLGIPHHALDDAICQARAVCAAWERLR